MEEAPAIHKFASISNGFTCYGQELSYHKISCVFATFDQVYAQPFSSG